MGLFSKISGLRKARADKRIAKALKIISSPKTIREDRLAAIDIFLRHRDSSVAVPALLQRFEYSLEHGINDSNEKDDVLAGIIYRKDEALPFVREHLQKTTRIAWPIKALKALGKENDVIEILKESLNFEDVSFDQVQVDKNYDILCYLIDYQLTGFLDKLVHFLNDPDERVRFACTEVLVEQEDPKVAEILEPFLLDFTAENIRIHEAALEAFISRGWRVKNLENYPEGKITSSVFVNEEGEIAKQ